MEKDIEFQSVEEIKTFQEGLLHKALHYLKDHSAYYQRMFAKYEIDIDKIVHIEDLVKLPFTEKKDLQLFNEDFLCCPKEKDHRLYHHVGHAGRPRDLRLHR
jgi:phenylacetate-CoA ligase